MKVTAERLPDSQILLQIEVDPERVQKSVERAYRRLSERINVPGFRRGKAPRHLVERMVGREALVADGIELLVPEVYREAVKETGIRPLDDPEFDIGQPDLEKATTEPLLIKATVPVEPTVSLGDYRSVKLARVPVDVTSQMVNETIDSMRERAASWDPVDRAARAGDLIVVDVEGRVGVAPALYSPEGRALLSASGGEVVFNETRAKVVLDPERGGPTPEFHRELVGLVAEADKIFQIAVPADYADKKLASQTVTFKAHVYEVKEKKLPELDDDFAKSLGGEWESLEALRSQVEQSLRSRLEHEAQHHFEESLIREAAERSSVELPPALVNREVDRLVRTLQNNLRQQRLELGQYLKMLSKSEAAYREELRPRAIENLKTYLVLREIGKAEGIQVGDEDVEQEIARVTESLEERRAKDVREALARPSERADIEFNLWQRKVVERLGEHAQRAIETVAGAEGGTVAAGGAGTDATAPAAGDAVTAETPAADATGASDAAEETGTSGEKNGG